MARENFLFWRARIGVRLYVAPLFVHNTTQFPFHRLERVVDHFVEWFVGAVVHLSFIGHQLVTAGNGHIDPAPVRITLLMGVIGLLDGDIAAVDVVAKFFQSRRIIQNEIVDLV
jgi:hypothetical protein